MEYIINQNQETFKIIMFEFDNRNWEICFEPNKTEEEIQHLIQLRITDLMEDYIDDNDYNKSDLFMDYIDYENKNNI
jgi:hypothetical protein